MAICTKCGRWYSREDDVYCCLDAPEAPTHPEVDPSFTIKVSKDGSAWCALIGDNLQVGVAAFGPTPNSALRNLCEEITVRREALVESHGAKIPWETVILAIIHTPPDIITTSDPHGPYCAKHTRMTAPDDVSRTVDVYCGSLRGHDGPCEFSRAV